MNGLVAVLALALTWTDDKAAGRLELRDGAEPVLTYNYGVQLPAGVAADRKRCCYVHPLYAPNGVVVTDDFPADHPHHRGVFWAWPVVRFEGKQYDGWMMRGGLEVRTEKTAALAGGVLQVENGWFAAGGRRIASERVRMEAGAKKGGAREIRFEVRLEAVAGPIELAGAPEQSKGYGGFSVRFAPRTETVIRTDTGLEEKDTDLVPHAWAELEAVYGGKKARLRIAGDERNPGHPNGWCLRRYGFLGVNYPGTSSVTLQTGKPLELRYTVTVAGE